LAADQLDPDDPALKAFLSRRAAGLQLVFRGTELPGCRFDVSPDLTIQTDWANHVRTAANVAAVYVRDLAARGQVTNALRAVGGMFKLAGHVAGNPDLNSILTAAALDSRALATLDRVLAPGVPQVGVNPHELHLHLGVEQLPLFRTDLRRALQHEQAFVYGRLAGLAEQDTGFGLVWLDDELQVHQALFRLLVEESAKPYPECLRGWAEVPAKLIRLPGVLHRLTAKAYEWTLPAVARADASRRVAQLAVAVARYQFHERRFPERAEDVIPKGFLQQIPTDPFTGEPLKLKATADGVVVYSVGPDGVDDGGAPLTEGQPQKGDIRVRIGGKK